MTVQSFGILTLIRGEITMSYFLVAVMTVIKTHSQNLTNVMSIQTSQKEINTKNDSVTNCNYDPNPCPTVGPRPSTTLPPTDTIIAATTKATTTVDITTHIW